MVILSSLFMHDGRRRSIQPLTAKVDRGIMAEWSDAIVAAVFGIITAIVWLVRLEFAGHKVKDLEKRLEEHINDDQNAHGKMLDDLSDIREGIAQIKGYLSKNIR